MENRKLIEDRTAVDEPEVSGAATPTGNGTPGKETNQAKETNAAEAGKPASAADPVTQNSESTKTSTSTGSWAPAASSATTPPAAPPATDSDDVIDWGAEDQGGLFGTKVPVSLALIMAFVLPAVGFFIGTLGSGKDSSSITVNAIITPQNASGPLQPGKPVLFTVLVQNANDYGVQVSTIGEGSSNATPGGCAEGTVTSAEVSAPRGYIRPNGVRAYQVPATLAANAPKSCLNQAFTLPLTVDLESAAG